MHSAVVKPVAQVAPAGASAPWQPLGPMAVVSPQYGLLSGRVTSISFDPADPTGNRVYVGTTGGGVWQSQNAATSSGSTVSFQALTDDPELLATAVDSSISIGAVSVQAGGAGVILAGTGDPNDALDSYYGGGILRSINQGKTWTLITQTADMQWNFSGEGFAGFAWSTTDPHRVVAAVSQAWRGPAESAEIAGHSYAGLYYSTDDGAHWQLATIEDSANAHVQGPNDVLAAPNGNAATAVVWNPQRNLFIAAVRYHGYYQSADGVTWTRLSAQPGTGLTAAACPANPGSMGASTCPIFRGTLAVNPVTGDTFAWTVDANNQDQGIWQDACQPAGGTCTNQAVSFGTRIGTSALETNVPSLGAATIANGDYNLALAALPSGQDTLLFAGANDLWQCSLNAGCVWRNTTNASACMSAKVAGYQHALAWNSANPQQMLIGNDSGLWRSMDDVAETGAPCSSSDAAHFDNLNGGLGSLAEVASLAPVPVSPYTLMAGLGADGVAGVGGTARPATQWAQILEGEGGPVAEDPAGAVWYANNQVGVSIMKCAQGGACTAADFGPTPVVNDSDVGGDGATMTWPAPFLVDALDPSQLLVGTCRVWRGPADGSAWGGGNALSGFLDHATGKSHCDGDAQVRSMASMAVNGKEVIYVGMAGTASGGGLVAGHVFYAVFDPASASDPQWADLALSPVSNDSLAFNSLGFDISSITIDPHAAGGDTLYATVSGLPSPTNTGATVYRSTNGGASWSQIASNLPRTPVNALAVDPRDANTIYVATDAGVYYTQQVATCAAPGAVCWAPMGTGLPAAPVTQLSTAAVGVLPSVLVAGTYGRGIWQIPLLTAGTQLTSATAQPASLTFSAQAVGSTSTAQTVTVTNTSAVALVPTAVVATGDFGETDDCWNAVLNAGASCTVQVTFAPTQANARSGQLTIAANVSGGSLSVALNGTGTGQSAPPVLSVSPESLSFPAQTAGTNSAPQWLTITNSGTTAMTNVGIQIGGAGAASFSPSSNTCGASLASGAQCMVGVVFSPQATGSYTATLTVSSSTVGVAPVQIPLSGSSGNVAAVQVLPASLSFAVTGVGATGASQTVTVRNTGTLPLTNLVLASSSEFPLSANTCPATLAAGASCTAAVAFAPTVAGSRAGAFTVASSALSSSVQASLSGTGFDFLAEASGSATYTVSSGRTATYALLLTAEGTDGTFNLQCGSLPSHAVCSFSPASPTVTAGGSGTVALQVLTGQNATARPKLPVIGFGVLLILPLAWRRKRSALLLIALLVVLAGGISSCTASGGGSGGTGGGSGGGGSNTTPAGTYTVQVTVTANGVGHSVPFTLIVD